MNALRWAGLAVVFGVVLEATCRVEDLVRYGTPPFTRFTSQADLAVRDRLGAHGRSNARFQKWVMNGIGVRGPAAAAAKPAGTVRVVAAGASETFGLYESPGREYPRQLEDSLRVSLGVSLGAAACRARVEVLNTALPGMSMPTVEQDLRLRVAAWRPDVVLLYPTPAFYLDDAAPFAAPPDSGPNAGVLAASRAMQPRAAKRLRDQIKETLPRVVQNWLRERDVAAEQARHPSGWRFDSAPGDRLAQFDADLRRAIGTARAIGAVPVVATHANAFVGARAPDAYRLQQWERLTPRAPGAVILAFERAALERTVRAARDSGVALADVAGGLAGGDPAARFADFSHFTDAGSARVAAVLAAALRPVVAARAGCAQPR